MQKRDRFRKRSLFVFAFYFAGGIAPAQDPGAARLLPSPSELPGWASGGPFENYEREGLYGYINGGSEIFLQYDFRRVDVGRYKKGEGESVREVTVDLYRMGSPLDAYGIFSISRGGGEKAIDIGGIPNWISESQASLAAGSYYVNIIGFGTGEADITAFARLLSRKLAAAGATSLSLAANVGPWSALPPNGLLRNSVRFIRGNLAAQEESEILAPDFWKFAAGTVAASARYAPDGRKLIVLDFVAEPSELPDDVRGVFAEYLTDIQEETGVLSAKNSAGHIFLFAARGRRAALVFGKKDEAAARSSLEASLK